MEWIKNILINYWPQILAILLFIGSFILQIIRKKPISDIDTFIYKFSILATRLAEAGTLKGQDKKNAAITYVCQSLKDTYPEIDVAKYVNYISQVIEAILSTPQKKK